MPKLKYFQLTQSPNNSSLPVGISKSKRRNALVKIPATQIEQNDYHVFFSLKLNLTLHSTQNTIVCCTCCFSAVTERKYGNLAPKRVLSLLLVISNAIQKRVAITDVAHETREVQ